MRVKKIAPPSRSYSQLQPDQRYYLEHGPLIDGMAEQFKDWDYLREIWGIHKKEICDTLHKEEPSRMPWAFWVFDTPGAPNKEGISTFWQVDSGGYVIEETEAEILRRLDLLEKARKFGFIEK